MNQLEDEIQEASRGSKVPHHEGDQAKEELLKKKALETEKSFEKVNNDRKSFDRK